MTGTSIDALDAALVAVEGSGLAMRASLRAGASWPLGDLSAPLRAAAEQRPMSAGDFAAIAHRLGVFHAERLAPWLASLSARPDLVCVHGQTVFHAPPVSWQLIDAAPIAHALGVPVVFDLRRADLAAGGQGAPITPLADWVLFRDDGAGRAVVNLGGFCNITLLPPACGPERVRGFDVCACNQVLDAVARAALGAPFDEGGRAALRGKPDPRALAELAGILEAQRAAGRSLGTGDEAASWAARFSASLTAEDLAATACAAVAASIVAGAGDSDELLLAGGGVRNAALVGAISEQASPARVRAVDDLGIPASHREAVAFAVLGALCADRVPITLPQVTGCREPAPVGGVWVTP